MGRSAEPESLVASLLRELEDARAEIPPMPGWKSEETAWKAVALSDEVEQLCRAASLADDRQQAHALLGRARRKLRALHALLDDP